MTRTQEVFLSLLRSALHDEAPSDPELSGEEWSAVFQLAEEHKLLSLLYHAAAGLPSLRRMARDEREKWRGLAIRRTIYQIVQQNEFLTILLHLQQKGLDPAVLKGCICRQLYKIPALRPSVDEDLLIPPEDAVRCHDALLREGMFSDHPEDDPAQANEMSFHRENSPSYIEVHTSAFEPDSTAYGDCNAPFVGVLDRTVTLQIDDVTVRTLAPTDHLLYLICHAYKHFLYSGFGIRQVCDICLYASHYGAELDWEHISSACCDLRIQRFTAALFRIGEAYLGFPVPTAFSGFDDDVQPLLDDILSGGLYGAEDIDRLHASTLTLDAVAAQRTGRRRGGALRSVFLPAGDLAGRYPYLRARPWLLPVAWTQRVWDYVFRQKHVHPTQSVRIGNRRIALFRRYGVID